MVKYHDIASHCELVNCLLQFNKRSQLYPHAQRNAFHRRAVRLQSRSFTSENQSLKVKQSSAALDTFPLSDCRCL